MAGVKRGRFIAQSGGLLRPAKGNTSAPFTVGTGTIDHSKKLVIHNVTNRYWIRADARHLTGPNGTIASVSWNLPRIGGALPLTNGFELLYVCKGNSATTTVTVTITDNTGAVATYSAQTPIMPTNHSVGDGDRQWKFIGLDTKGYWQLRPKCHPDSETIIEFIPVPVPTGSQNDWVTPPPMIATTRNTGSITVNANGVVVIPQGNQNEVSIETMYMLPTSVSEPTIYCWIPRATFPSLPDQPSIDCELITIDVRPPVATIPQSTQQIEPLYASKPGHALGPIDVQKIPLANSSDFSGAPTQQAMVNEWKSRLGIGCPYMNPWGFSPVFFKTDLSTVTKQNVYFMNYQTWAFNATGNVDNIFMRDAPIPDYAFAAFGTDNAMVVTDGDTEMGLWLAHRRPYSCNLLDGEFGGYYTDRPKGPGGYWWATSGGKTSGLATSTSGRLGPNHYQSACGLSMQAILIMIEEARRAKTVYLQQRANGKTLGEAAALAAQEIKHPIYMSMVNTRYGKWSWPAQRSDGGGTINAASMGQIITVHPNFPTNTENWLTTNNIMGPILTEVIKLRGLFPSDTTYGQPEIGFQSGKVEEVRTGVNPWSEIFADHPATWDILHPLKNRTTFTDPTDGQLKNVWQIKKIINDEFEWDNIGGPATFGVLAIDEQFTTVATAQWQIYDNSTEGYPESMQTYMAANVVSGAGASTGAADGSSLRLRTIRGAGGSTGNFTAGMIDSKPSGMTLPLFHSGEFRARIPHGQGLMPAFRLIYAGSGGANTAKFDVFEARHAQYPGKVTTAWHRKNNAGVFEINQATAQRFYEAPTNGDMAWHRIAWRIEPESGNLTDLSQGVRFSVYLNGYKYLQFVDTQMTVWPTQPLVNGSYWMLQIQGSQIGGREIGYPDDPLGQSTTRPTDGTVYNICTASGTFPSCATSVDGQNIIRMGTPGATATATGNASTTFELDYIKIWG